MKLHERAVGLAKRYKETEGELLEVLMQMQDERLFIHFNCKGIYSYCIAELGLSDAQAGYFSRVARKSREVPELKAAIDDGTLTLSQARRIVPVITKDNHAEWIEQAAILPQKELERVVTIVNPNAAIRERLKPVTPTRSELKLGVDLELEKKLKHVQNLESQRLGRAVSLEETMKAMVELYLDRKDPVRKAVRASSSRKAIPRAPATPGRHRIAASLAHAVHLRDGFQCTSPGCTERRWLHLHHIVPVERGGLNTLTNLRTICFSHHRLAHLAG